MPPVSFIMFAGQLIFGPSVASSLRCYAAIPSFQVQRRKESASFKQIRWRESPQCWASPPLEIGQISSIVRTTPLWRIGADSTAISSLAYLLPTPHRHHHPPCTPALTTLYLRQKAHYLLLPPRRLHSPLSPRQGCARKCLSFAPICGRLIYLSRCCTMIQPRE